jgi:hypothetical protein
MASNISPRRTGARFFAFGLLGAILVVGIAELTRPLAIPMVANAFADETRLPSQQVKGNCNAQNSPGAYIDCSQRAAIPVIPYHCIGQIGRSATIDCLPYFLELTTRPLTTRKDSTNSTIIEGKTVLHGSGTGYAIYMAESPENPCPKLSIIGDLNITRSYKAISVPSCAGVNIEGTQHLDNNAYGIEIRDPPRSNH